ncbi:hypothetical protein GWI33_019166 [Rhynchophorus ferrugineus]|uniref:Cuticle protein n=1 Tax=Rhynchophorus ferrugineus TaxID=354439 RepID=A0A834HUF5_RHYFE|nr:hypothetical protein GWI33_019166 [Rhynchophorus ferrugineus]
MNSFTVAALFACLAVCNAGLLVGPSAKVLQGPSSKTTLVGPEGSVISAHAPGGQVVHEEHPGVVAHVAPVVAHAAPTVAYAAPVIAHAAPVVAHATPAATTHSVYSSVISHPSVVSHAAPVVAHAVPSAHSAVVAHSSAYEHNSVVVAGPSGSISTGPHSAVVAHAAPVVAHAAPVVAHPAPVVAYSAPVVSHADADDNGHEGQYVHDHSETLYDDGSYKPHAYHH